MTDEQIKKIIDKTFAEVNLLVKEVQAERKYGKNKPKGSEKKKSLESSLKE